MTNPERSKSRSKSPIRSKSPLGKNTNVNKPTYRGGGASNYIPYEYRHLKEKQSAFAAPTKQQKHAGAIDPSELPYGKFVKEREFQNKISKDLTEGYVSRYNKEYIMCGQDKIDSIRQEIDNLLHNKKKLEVFGREEDKASFLSPKKHKNLLYGQKLKLDGTVSSSGNK